MSEIRFVDMDVIYNSDTSSSTVIEVLGTLVVLPRREMNYGSDSLLEIVSCLTKTLYFLAE